MKKPIADLNSKDISKGLLLGKGLIHGTNFTNSTEERAGLCCNKKPEQITLFGQINQTLIIDEFLNKKTNGFFIGTTHM